MLKRRVYRKLSHAGDIRAYVPGTFRLSATRKRSHGTNYDAIDQSQIALAFVCTFASYILILVARIEAEPAGRVDGVCAM
ncbi:MAG: hypothetical protein A3G24_15060 [Betaproteobacteria bacterium RIFCSPLOWO2_12_FULL_62_13]|nr:MAG: hypothetical protein A3G24_15060 [Betaproteobacteria bacterium RIFCSPLOWO2_12_FULL_62_13]